MCQYKIRKARKWKDAKEFEKACNEYFESCYAKRVDENGNEYEVNIAPVTVRGLANYMGVTRETFCDWERTRPDISDTIKDAKDICHRFNEDCLFDKNKPTIGVLFSLKNNWGWKDTTEVKQDITTNSPTLNISFVDKKEDGDK